MRRLRALAGAAAGALCLMFGAGQPASAQIDYANGFSGFPVGGALVGYGSASLTGTVVRMTGGVNPEAGYFYTRDPQNITSFHNHFQLQILTSMHGAEAVMADGISFVIQNYSNSAYYGGGGGMGTGADRHTYDASGNDITPIGLKKSVNIKFDVFSNEGEGFSSTGMYVGGVPPTVPATDLNQYGINLSGHHLMDVTMDYDGALLKVVIVDTKTGASATQTYSVNIPAVMQSNTAYVGFVADEGGFGARQSILCWDYNRPLRRVVRVSPNGSDAGANDGSTWATAVATIPHALTLASQGGYGSEVWVAAGTYAGGFTVPGGVALYGGFAGSETSRDARSVGSNVTSIVGNGSGVGITCQGGWASRIDGFTIRGFNRAITTDGASPIIANNTITGNAGAWGSGVAGDNSSPLVMNNTITNNTSVGDGGGVLVTGAGSAISYPYITQNLIQGNSASGSQSNGYGGGIIFWRCTDMVIAGNDIRNNYARFGGGGVHVNPESRGGVTVVRNVFAENVAGTWGGAGLDTYTATWVCVSDNDFSGNNSTAGGAGGFMISQSSRAKVVRNTVESNYGYWEGGGLLVNVPDTLAWFNLFHINHSIALTGGLDLNRASGSAQYNTFWDNVGVVGGGLRVVDCSPVVANNVMVGNQASNASGGLEMWDSTSVVANNLFFANNAFWGGGISMGNSSPRIFNNTLAYNHGANNAGINIYLSSPQIANNIVAFSDSAGIGGYNESQPAPSIHHNLVYGNGGGQINDFAPGPANLSFDPLFVNPPAGDFRLQAWSQAIDRGDNASSYGTQSLDWNPRILNGTVDLGAFESPTPRQIDTDPPVTTATPSPGPNGYGWNNGDVSVTLTATDGAGSGVTKLIYSMSGAQSGGATVSGSTATIPVTTEGVTTITFHAVDLLGNVEADKSITIQIDRTAPTVTYTGARAYTVDETVTVDYSATDALSGIASDSGDRVLGVPAYTLALGSHTVAAIALDRAGNTGNASAAYSIGVTYDSLCALVDRWVTNEGMRTSLCAKLRNAQAAEQRGDLNAKAGLIGAFVNEVQAQSGKAIPADKADILIRLAQSL